MSIQILISGENAEQIVRIVLFADGTLKVVDLPDLLAGLTPSQPKPSAEEKPAENDSAPESDEPIPTDVELRALARDIALKEGGKDAVKRLLERYGVSNVTAVPPEKRLEFKRDLEILLSPV